MVFSIEADRPPLSSVQIKVRPPPPLSPSQMAPACSSPPEGGHPDLQGRSERIPFIYIMGPSVDLQVNWEVVSTISLMRNIQNDVGDVLANEVANANNSGCKFGCNFHTQIVHMPVQPVPKKEHI